MSKITSISTGVPGHRYIQNDLFCFADKMYSRNADDSRKLKFLYAHSGINTRYSILPDFTLPVEERTFFKDDAPDISRRMELYNEYAAPLSVETIEKCISGKIDKGAITHLITVSCTGMSAPGLDLQILEMMGLPDTIMRTSVNFMGCYAAIHGMKIADAFCKSTPNANVIVVCTEFCSLHFQQGFNIDNLTSSLIFADGCAALLMQSAPGEKGIILENFFSQVMFKGKKDMAWELSPTGFLMTLSGYIPDLVKADFEVLVNHALEKTGRKKEDITDWCIHPGGKKILDVIAESMGLDKEMLHPSYEVLNDFGNMSSPTVLFVLEKILAEIKNSGESSPAIFGAAFGPGLTMETFTAVYG